MNDIPETETQRAYRELNEAVERFCVTVSDAFRVDVEAVSQTLDKLRKSLRGVE